MLVSDGPKGPTPVRERVKKSELCYYLSIRGVESPLAVVAGCKHLDQQGLAAVVRANYRVFAYKVVCA